MNDIQDLCNHFERLKERLQNVGTKKRENALSKANEAIVQVLEDLRPSQKELKKELLVNSTAIRIRDIIQRFESKIDLKKLAKSCGLTLKNPSFDHIMVGYYYPKNRLVDLENELKSMQKVSDDLYPSDLTVKWSLDIKRNNNIDEMEETIQEIIERHGLSAIRDFASRKRVKDYKNKNRKLASNAKKYRVIRSLAKHLWEEKQNNLALEGRVDAQ